MPETREPDAKDSANDEIPPDLESLRLSYWRRLVQEGKGRDLTVVETAAVLGISTRSVQRRIHAGKLRSYKDGHGRVLVVPFGELPEVWSEAAASQRSEELTRLWGEFKLIHHRLDGVQKERDALEAQLSATQELLLQCEQELAAMWRRLSARGVGDRPFDLATSEDAKAGVTRVRAQIASFRALARRKRPWSLAG